MPRLGNFQTGLGRASGGIIEFFKERIKKKLINQTIHSTNVLSGNPWLTTVGKYHFLHFTYNRGRLGQMSPQLVRGKSFHAFFPPCLFPTSLPSISFLSSLLPPSLHPSNPYWPSLTICSSSVSYAQDSAWNQVYDTLGRKNHLGPKREKRYLYGKSRLSLDHLLKIEKRL